MSTAPAKQPNWDMTPYFSAIDGSDYTAFVSDLNADISGLAGRGRELPALAAAVLPTWATFLTELEGATCRLEHLSSYLGCLGAADSRDERVQSESGKLASLGAEFDKVLVDVRAKLGAADQAVAETLYETAEIKPIRYAVGRLREQAKKTMQPELEGLAADLGVTGLSAWGRLYDQVSGNLMFDLDVPGQESRRLPVAMTRSLLEDGNPAVRKAAFEGSNRAWESVGETVSACLNAISGTRLALYERRGIDHYLEPACFDSAVDRETLETMFDVVRKRQGIPNRYLALKAKSLGKDKLPWYDLSAPMPQASSEKVNWDQAKNRVLESFGGFYPALRDFAQSAFDRNWIDYEPRDGKRPGGFCSSTQVIGQSRIFMTYNDTAGDVMTLAHELGHAFHSGLMKDMRPWSTMYPMTLAETASTFGEALVSDALLLDPSSTAKDRLSVLDGRLSDAAVFLCNIPSRFEFERSVYEERSNGELSISRFKELMMQAEKSCYGDALDPENLDPWFWASKLHFYITEVSFYNFPYTFGYLFSLGIFARAKKEGTAFLETYEELLRKTGSDTAENVAKSVLGVDLGQPGFWNDSIDLLEADLKAYEQALATA